MHNSIPSLDLPFLVENSSPSSTSSLGAGLRNQRNFRLKKFQTFVRKQLCIAPILKSLTVLFLIPCALFAELGYVEPWGKDAMLCNASPQTLSPRKLSPMGRVAEQIILFHHNVLTHISGPRSHFRPTSSQYMLQAIREYGFVKGYLMGCDRLLRENSEEWHYRTRLINDKLYKWDPPTQ